MRILITGSAGHLGEALSLTLRERGCDITGVDLRTSAFTTAVGSIVDRGFVRECMRGVEAVLHTATLHKPHLATHSGRDFVDTNVTGTLNLLEEAAAAGVTRFVFTSTTSVFGSALVPPPGAAASWIDESVVPVSKNVYGATKLAAEQLCGMVHRTRGLACLVLRTSRFFPEEDDQADVRSTYADANVKLNEFLHRRVEIADVVSAHLLAMERAESIGFDCCIVSATTPFTRRDLADLRRDAPKVVRRLFPDYNEIYSARGWRMFPSIDRVYDNGRARERLGWVPAHDFGSCLERIRNGHDPRSDLARAVGIKGYHERAFGEMPYPV